MKDTDSVIRNNDIIYCTGLDFYDIEIDVNQTVEELSIVIETEEEIGIELMPLRPPSNDCNNIITNEKMGEVMEQA